mgnify:FL=1
MINGWTILVHPLFLDQLESLTEEVEQLKLKKPESYGKKKATKLLANINKLAFQVIPQDPTLSDYRQGDTLGKNYKHWFRGKFNQQYRLFFRFDSLSKIIIYAWVNDGDTLRAYGSKTDAYKVFANMLDDGDPPDDWDQLLKKAAEEKERLKKSEK